MYVYNNVQSHNRYISVDLNKTVGQLFTLIIGFDEKQLFHFYYFCINVL